MSSNLKAVLANSFGDDSDPRGFWLLLKEHIEHLQVRNYAPDTVRLRASYVKAFALWCLDRDLNRPAMITKPMLESYQRFLYRYRKANGKPLSWREPDHALGASQSILPLPGEIQSPTV